MNIDNININYIDYGNNNGKTLVFLHGWGQNIEMMKMLGDHFSKTNRIIIMDLPGFGLSEEPKNIIGVLGYTKIVKKLLDKLEIIKPILIGHSFGGRIAVKYSSCYDVEKLILLAPALRGHDKKGLKTKVLKGLKKVPGINHLEGWAKNHIGSRDYKAASPIMKQVLVETVNEDLCLDAKKITVPTILIYGTNDEEVPYEDIKEYERLIDDCGLIIYENCTHYAYLENLEKTIRIIKNFIG